MKQYQNNAQQYNLNASDLAKMNRAIAARKTHKNRVLRNRTIEKLANVVAFIAVAAAVVGFTYWGLVIATN